MGHLLIGIQTAQLKRGGGIMTLVMESPGAKISYFKLELQLQASFVYVSQILSNVVSPGSSHSAKVITIVSLDQL